VITSAAFSMTTFLDLSLSNASQQRQSESVTAR
jgi:hypothetical protein